MTKEQIEELTQLLEDWEPSKEYALKLIGAATNRMPRLLKERQRLLEALRAARDQLLAACEEDCTAEAALAYAAIAFAEEEAKP